MSVLLFLVFLAPELSPQITNLFFWFFCYRLVICGLSSGANASLERLLFLGTWSCIRKGQLGRHCPRCAARALWTALAGNDAVAPAKPLQAPDGLAEKAAPEKWVR